MVRASPDVVSRRGGVRVRDAFPVHPRRQPRQQVAAQALAHQGRGLRVRHVTRGRGQLAPLGEILFGGHAVHPVRHRSGVPLPVGHGLSGDASESRDAEHDSVLHDLIPRHPVHRLRLCAQERRVQLEEVMNGELEL